ncbi:hypothetical protein VPH35_122242 [Triticum aestivum]
MATEAGHPAWFLTAAQGFVGDRSNERNATGFTRHGLSIKASFVANRPPQPSKLWVHCPEAVHVDTPRVICVVGDLILFRVDISPDCVPDSRFSTRMDCDYFIYHADPNLRVLTLLTDMRTRCFEDTEEFDWVIPFNTDLYYHTTSNVITIGGEYGTIGWVDLWRGILFCDVLREKPTLNGLPLPLPMEQITSGHHLGRAMDCRGIAFVNGCLKFVQLDIIPSYDTDIMDPERGYPTLLVDDWAISSWINPTMENSYKAWGEPECTVQAAGITIKTDMISHLTGVLQLASDESFADYLQHLVVSDPSPSLDDDGVVYLIAREKLCHQKSWILALDMNTKKLQSVVPFGIVKVEDPSDSDFVKYCTSRSSSNT